MKKFIGMCVILLVCSVVLSGCSSTAFHQEEPALSAVQPQTGTRHWLGPAYWGNRLQDWRFRDGKFECITPQGWLPARTIHDVTRQVTDNTAGFETSVVITIPSTSKDKPHATDAVAGLLIGVGKGEMDYRAAAIVHHWSAKGGGLFIGVDTAGKVFFADNEKPWLAKAETAQGNLPRKIQLIITGRPGVDGYNLKAEAINPTDGTVISSTTKAVPANRVLGNVAIVSHPGTRDKNASAALYTFGKWLISGDAVSYKPRQVMGPIAGTQYTVSNKTLKLTAQFLPIGDTDNKQVLLQVKRAGKWIVIAEAPIASPDYLALFRVEGWDDTQDTTFRVVYKLGGEGNDGVYTWSGIIRKNPIDSQQIKVGALTCVLHSPWGKRTDWVQQMFFPHEDLTERVAQHNPDIVFFLGDQMYEGTPTFADRQNIMLDYQYKWILHYWAFRELTRNTPSISIPDDHDVYQGNYWGQGGRKAPSGQDSGGYVHPAEFVSMVHRTHTSHMPDPPDTTPIEQDIPVYHCGFTWGRISFAVLADRMFKTGSKDNGLPPSGTGRSDHYNNPDFDTADLDMPHLVLLGERQLNFLEDWAGDWRGADMKLALSQTIFANMATHHGGGLSYLIADLDSNGWPQTGRNKAIGKMRKAFAMHIGGDQHLATLVHHGIDEHKDANWSFCVPAVANAYPRAWAPEATGKYVMPMPQQFMGDRLDGFKNKVTVYAASNPGKDMGHEPKILHNKMPGYGIIVLDKEARTYEAQCWPRWADPSDPSQQYEGWPRTIDQMDNFGKEPIGYLPQIKVKGVGSFVIHVKHRKTGELVYALRVKGDRFKPMVLEDAVYDVVVSEPDKGLRRNLKGLKIGKSQMIEIDLESN